MTVTVFTKHNCPECARTKKFMDSRGLDYQVVNVEEDAQALEKVKAMGYQAVPVTEVITDTGESVHWKGARVDLIRSHIIKAQQAA